jgi:endoglucanase
MKAKTFSFLKKFADSPSPSGFEQPAQRVWRDHVSSHVDRVDTDVMGNSWGVIEGKSTDAAKRPRVMLAGHCDEVGLMVRYVDDQGFISFAAVGGVDAHLLPGCRVTVHGAGGEVPGVIGRNPIHLLEADERTKVAKLKTLFIDIGVEDREAAEALVAIGDPVTFTPGVDRLQKDIVMGRGFDDKVGAMIVGEVLRRVADKKISLDCDLYGVSTVQEEIGLRGAHTSAFGIDPDVGICVEVTFASDYPGADKKTVGDVQVGKGPVLSRGANINHKLFELLKATAKENKIPLQFEAAPRATGTDANVMQLTRGGVATALVEIPLRYMHTSGEVLSLSDVENAITLIVATLQKINGTIDWRPE